MEGRKRISEAIVKRLPMYNEMYAVVKAMSQFKNGPDAFVLKRITLFLKKDTGEEKPDKKKVVLSQEQRNIVKKLESQILNSNDQHNEDIVTFFSNDPKNKMREMSLSAHRINSKIILDGYIDAASPQSFEAEKGEEGYDPQFNRDQIESWDPQLARYPFGDPSLTDLPDHDEFYYSLHFYFDPIKLRETLEEIVVQAHQWKLNHFKMGVGDFDKNKKFFY